MICRACGSTNLREVVNMGRLPLAGNYADGASAQRYPLEIDHCLVCDLLQVRQTVPHDVVFGPNYCYASSTVPTLVEHFEQLASVIHRMVPNGLVLEVGSNDGILLKALMRRGLRCVGVDSSANVVELAQDSGCAATTMVFKSDTALDIAQPGGAFDLVTCSNVFAHNEDPRDMLEGIRKVLKPGGQLIIEVHDATELFRLNQWDCFYHEHVFYWTPAALGNILEANGFSVIEITRTKMHGGALRVRARHASKAFVQRPGELDWSAFGQRVKRSAEVLNHVVMDLERDCYLVGAAGRSATLINYAGIIQAIDCAYDGSPLRIGKRIAGTDIPILDEKEILDDEVTFLLGAWHLEEQLVPKILRACPKPYGIITPLPYDKIQ